MLPSALLSHLVIHAQLSAVDVLQNVDPGVKPNFSSLPFISWLRNIVGGVQGAMLIICVLLLIIGVVVLVVSKVGSSRGGAAASSSLLLWVGIAALVVGSSSGVIAWLGSQDTGF